MVTTLITPLMVLITVLTKSHDPPSRHSPDGDFSQEEILQLHLMAQKRARDGGRRVRIYGKVGPDGIGYLPGGGATAKSAPVLNIMASTRAILLGSRGLWPFLPVGLALPGGKVCPFPK